MLVHCKSIGRSSGNLRGVQAGHLGVLNCDWVANRNHSGCPDPQRNPRLVDQPRHRHHTALIQLSQTEQPGLIHQFSLLHEYGTHPRVNGVRLEIRYHQRHIR